MMSSSAVASESLDDKSKKRNVEGEEEDEAEMNKRRRRVMTQRYNGSVQSFKEEQLIAAALRNSLQYITKPNHKPVNAPVFFPSLEEFSDPLAYIAAIHKIVEPYGICKIVPPEGWNPPYSLDVSNIEIPTKRQKINLLGEGEPYEDGKNYTFQEYFDQAKIFTEKISMQASAKDHEFNPKSAKSWENLYWRIVEGGWGEDVVVDYGNDMNAAEVGSGFPLLDWNDLPPSSVKPQFDSLSYYKRTGWNIANTPRLPDSVLRNIKDKISGINVPWIYFGMPFTTFSWHNEDNYLHSINYMHLTHTKSNTDRSHTEQQETRNSKASPYYRLDLDDNDAANGKIWYGVSSKDTWKFEACLKELMPQRFQQDPDLIYHITTMVSPPWLMERGIQVSRLVQRAGEFVITYPAAYHAGFSLSWNSAEAVNFGTLEWLELGRICKERYRRDNREPVIAHDKLLWSLVVLENQRMTKKCDLILLLNQLNHLREDEFNMRDRAQNMGIKYSSRMPEDDIFSDEAECKRKCDRCKMPCSFSGVVCTCKVDKIVCPLHIRDLCSCQNENKCLVYWKSIKDIDILISKIAARIDSIKHKDDHDEIEDC